MRDDGADTHAMTDNMAAPAEPGTGGHLAKLVSLEAALLEAQEETRERQAAMHVIRNELARMREDLDAERQRRTEDAERFRDGLARVRDSAEAALAAERDATRRMATELEQVQEALTQMRTELESRDTREHEMRAELGRLREESAGAVARMERARSAVDEAREEAARLLAVLRAETPDA
jgi:chromosome segregation ATPase